VQLKNQWGTFVSASSESLQLAMRAADWEKLLIDQDPTFELDLTDAGCPACWPIANATYVLVPIKGSNANSLRVLDFFEQALKQGDELAAKEGYVCPCPGAPRTSPGWRHAAGKPRLKERARPSRSATEAGAPHVAHGAQRMHNPSHNNATETT
jgi:hypothetical protein